MTDEDCVLNTREAAEFLNAHTETLRRLARNGLIPAFKLAKDWRFNKAALRRWSETHHTRSRKLSILVVDDEASIRNLLRLLLRSEGYRVSVAADGPEALKLIGQEVPDLVLLDLQMLQMNGPDVLKEIRHSYGDLPVIIITGYPDSDLMQEALRYTPLLMLSKPIRKEHLLKMVTFVAGRIASGT